MLPKDSAAVAPSFTATVAVMLNDLVAGVAATGLRGGCGGGGGG